jgi:hypothetical protein
MTLNLTSSSPFFSKEETIFGLSYAEWTEKWWHWFYSAKNLNNLPRYFEKNVTFFPSIIGNEKEPLHLKTTVSKDHAILISVAKWMSFGLSFMSDSKLREMADDRIDTLQKKFVMIDDEVVEPERVMSRIFTINLKRDIINPKVSYTRINHIRKGKYKAIGNGYWLFIKPNELEKGIHNIHTIATCEAGIVNIDVYHELEIQ